MDYTVNKEELYQLIKKAVAEVLENEFTKLKLDSINFVEDKEQEDIERSFGNPEDYEEQEISELL